MKLDRRARVITQERRILWLTCANCVVFLDDKRGLEISLTPASPQRQRGLCFAWQFSLSWTTSLKLRFDRGEVRLQHTLVVSKTAQIKLQDWSDNIKFSQLISATQFSILHAKKIHHLLPFLHNSYKFTTSVTISNTTNIDSSYSYDADALCKH